jgi:hypothetical protein
MASTAVTGQKRRTVTKDERAALAAELGPKYQAGESIRDLVAETGLSYGFIHKLLTVDCGLALRIPGNRPKAEVA